jgi:hypothetical protein
MLASSRQNSACAACHHGRRCIRRTSLQTLDVLTEIYTGCDFDIAETEVDRADVLFVTDICSPTGI